VLSYVSCRAPLTCMATGSADYGAMSLIERWSWRGWTAEPTPVLPGFHILFAGVSCPSAASCTVVGTAERGVVGSRFSVAAVYK
jgi:hypothetical protein